MLDEDYLRDLFEPFGRVSIRRMFGGQALYLDGAIIALVLGDDTLYLKADGQTAPAFEAAGSRQFVYEASGRVVQLPYWRIPDAALDDRDEMRPWVERARAAAARNPTKPKSRKRTKA